jgi:segregation and condensation protein A
LVNKTTNSMANPDIQETQQHEKLTEDLASDSTTESKASSVGQVDQADVNADEHDQSVAEAVGVATRQVSAQGELPFALIQGEPLTVVPQDLYIPPDALEVILEAFEGPLDLLLYLIKRQNIDILDIPLEETTRQYMHYIDLMQNLKIELAAEYLLMAAMLAEIKSRMLLPRPAESIDEDDPRAELIRRLQEYERFKTAAQNIDELPRVSREIYLTNVELPEMQHDKPVPEVDLRDVLFAFKDAMSRADMYSHHHIQREALSVRERMSSVLSAISSEGFINYTSLFTIEEGRRGVVVTLLAILELVKEQLIDLVQSEAFAPIHLKTAGSDAGSFSNEQNDDEE